MRRAALTRRTVLAGIGAGMAAGPAWTLEESGAQEPLGQRLAPLWAAWKQAHTAPEGRVVDGLQDGVSHSEGQGYGMVLAEAMGDAETFDALWRWTQANLSVREDDALLAWRWRPDAADPIDDFNNASDGDLFCAWALLRGARRFGDEAYAEASASIARSLAQTCVRVIGEEGATEHLFLPAADGFEREDHIALNPSYAMPLALDELSAAHDLPALAEVAATARRMNDRLSFGGLPPDWVGLYDTGFGPPEGWEDVFGYEALRVPLFEIWSGRPGASAVRAAAALYTRAWRPGSDVPTRVTRDFARVLERSPDPGYGAIAALTSCAVPDIAPRAFPAFAPSQPYYPATLHLMTLVASHEAHLEC